MDYAEVAPLPAAFADHLFRRFQAQGGTERLFYDAVREKERIIFDVLDSFVLAGKLTRDEVRKKLRFYGHGVSQSTIHYWQQRGIVEKDGFGKIKPLSAEALLIAAMLDKRPEDEDDPEDEESEDAKKRLYNFLPSVPTGDSWCCYVQRCPDADVGIWPSGRLHELPAATLCWTRLRSACWEPGWQLIGDPDDFLGCMRFVGIKRSPRGRIWYEVNIDDIRRWNSEIADQYIPSAGNMLASLQDLCRPLFNVLAIDRLGERM